MPPKQAANQKRPRTTTSSTFHPAAKLGSSSSGPVATSSSSRPAATIATSSSRVPALPSSSPATAIASPFSAGTVVEEVPRKEADDEKLWLRDNGATYPTLRLLGNCVEQFRSAYNNAERILHQCEAYVAAVAFQPATEAPTQLFSFR